MRILMTLLVGAVVLAGARAQCGDQSASSAADDFANAARDEPCPDGHARNTSGLCNDTRGFTLFSGTTGAASNAPGAGRSALSDLAINFMPNSAVITGQGKRRAQALAQAMLRPFLIKRRFEIAGYTDASGPEPINLKLSLARAEAVRRFLVEQGVAASRLDARGYGSQGLILPDQPRDPRNRRVAAVSLN